MTEALCDLDVWTMSVNCPSCRAEPWQECNAPTLSKRVHLDWHCRQHMQRQDRGIRVAEKAKAKGV